MSKNYAIIIHFMLPLTTFYRSGAHRSDVYKWDAFVTSWRFYNRAWQPQRHDGLPETSGTLWIHRGALTNQRCSLATGCGIIHIIWWFYLTTPIIWILLMCNIEFSSYFWFVLYLVLFPKEFKNFLIINKRNIQYRLQQFDKFQGN